MRKVNESNQYLSLLIHNYLKRDEKLNRPSLWGYHATQLVCQREIMLPRFHWGSVISLADGVFFNEECNYLNRSAKDMLLLPPLRLLLLLLLLPASRFPTHLRGSSCKKKEKEKKRQKILTLCCLQLFLPPSVSTLWMRLVLCHRCRLDGIVSVLLIK